ncbi:MAG: hypothetical protein AB2693_12705 [Candidatus Thiodiazotropha sp.]
MKFYASSMFSWYDIGCKHSLQLKMAWNIVLMNRYQEISQEKMPTRDLGGLTSRAVIM